MKSMPLRLFAATCLALLCGTIACRAKPALFIIGDSTVRNGTAGQMGWGDPLVRQFDPAKIDVINRAIGGRSSRTFLTEGRWDAVMAHLKPGDFVLMQFGHNDGGKLNDERCRASLKGIGEESEDIIRNTDKQPETVQSYGWYLRKFITDTQGQRRHADRGLPDPAEHLEGRKNRPLGRQLRRLGEAGGGSRNRRRSSISTIC